MAESVLCMVGAFLLLFRMSVAARFDIIKNSSFILPLNMIKYSGGTKAYQKSGN